MKKVSLTFASIVLSLSMLASANPGMSVSFNGKVIDFDVSPRIINGRTMVPVRTIFEAMGATVNWDAKKNVITGTKGSTIVKMKINEKELMINNYLYPMDTAPFIKDGRTLAPARFVAESFGYDVAWKEISKTISITDKENIIPSFVSQIYAQIEGGNYCIYFGLQDENLQYISYKMPMDLTIQNSIDEIIYAKSYILHPVMFSNYKIPELGEQPNLLCVIKVPIKDLSSAKTSTGLATLRFTFPDGVQQNHTVDLSSLTPDSNENDLQNISYDKGPIVLNHYYSSGKVMSEMRLNYFEITNIKQMEDSNKILTVSFVALGYITGSNYCDFNINCYDRYGQLLKIVPFKKTVVDNQKFKLEESFECPIDTSKIKLSVE